MFRRIEWSGDVVSSHAPVRGHHDLAEPGQLADRFKSCPREGASNAARAVSSSSWFQVMPP